MPPRRQVKSGERYGRWTALRDGDYSPGTQRVLCKCDCGTVRTLGASNLKQRGSSSCGCARKQSVSAKCRRPVAVGSRFGRLRVVGEPEYGLARYPLVPCECDCGKAKHIPQKCLKRGTTRSCGCLHRERSSEAASRDIASRANRNRLYVGPRGRIWMRSSWEVAVAHRLDRDGLCWEYEPKSFLLGTSSRYTPDFMVDLQSFGVLWVEVKGEFFGSSRSKLHAFRREGNALLLIGKDNFSSYAGLSPSEANKKYPAAKAVVG